MTSKTISRAAEIAAAAALAVSAHERLRAELPFLPVRSAADFVPRITYMAQHGIVLGLFEDTQLTAFLGAFRVDDFRNAGPGSVGPDWCHGILPGIDVALTYRRLYRALAPQLIAMGCRIQAFSFYASERQALAAMGLTGFGCIVMDAGRPTAELLAELPVGPVDLDIRRAGVQDAVALAELDAALAAHIAAAPVLMPNPRGRSAAQWAEWLSNSERVALLAWRDGQLLGFIKAEQPQFDVTYAVHGDSTLAINGMYVKETARRTAVGRALLVALAREAAAIGKELVSVDCETTNPEAYGFWSRWFRPVTWSLERRV